MNISSAYIPTAAEIAYNLSIMEKAITRDGKAKEIDEGFIAIFRADLDNLKKQEDPSQLNKVQSLDLRLESIAQKIFEAQSKISQYVSVSLPLVDVRQPISSLMNGYEEKSDMHDGLKSLSKHYEFHRVKGDGHCLFRAVTAGLLLDNAKKVEEVFLKSGLFEMADFQALRAPLQRLYNKEITALSILQDLQISDLFVKAMRYLAVSEVEKAGQKDDDFSSTITVESGKNFTTYLHEMRSMEEKRYGGEPEINALKAIFQLNTLLIYDAASCGKNKTVIPPHIETLSEESFALLRRGEHYDLLVPN